MINARADTLAEKPAFRQAFQKRRCVIAADGFYEWKTLTKGKPKQPFHIRHPDGELIAQPVSTRVNKVANDGPELLEPVGLQEEEETQPPKA